MIAACTLDGEPTNIRIAKLATRINDFKVRFAPEMEWGWLNKSYMEWAVFRRNVYSKHFMMMPRPAD
jgi:hypothetical protein